MKIIKKIAIIFFCFLILFCGKKIQIDQESLNESKSKEEAIVDTMKHTTIKIEPDKKVISQKNKIGFLEYTRGIYLTAYTVSSSKFYSILDSAQAAGINTVVFDLKNMNGHVFFSIPQKDLLTDEKIKPIINIPNVVKELHKRKMKAVARVVMFHDQFAAERDSTLRPISSSGKYWKETKRRKPSWLDPSNSKVQKELLSILKKIAKSGIDEIQLDYIRFPTQGNISDAIFSFQREDSLFAKADSNYVLRTKSNIIGNFIIQAKDICSKYNVSLTADVFAIVAWQRKSDIAATGQDIEKMTKHLDAIHPMIYSSHFSDNFGYREDVSNEPYFIIYKATKLTKKYAEPNCKVIPYIQANSWKVNYNREYIISQIKAIENIQCKGYILWNASNRYFSTLNWLKEYYAD
jgi:hypothetical protein